MLRLRPEKALLPPGDLAIFCFGSSVGKIPVSRIAFVEKSLSPQSTLRTQRKTGDSCKNHKIEVIAQELRAVSVGRTFFLT
jgi:hypothetical protein